MQREEDEAKEEKVKLRVESGHFAAGSVEGGGLGCWLGCGIFAIIGGFCINILVRRNNDWCGSCVCWSTSRHGKWKDVCSASCDNARWCWRSGRCGYWCCVGLCNLIARSLPLSLPFLPFWRLDCPNIHQKLHAKKAHTQESQECCSNQR